MSAILSEMQKTVGQSLRTALQRLDEGVCLEEIVLTSPAQVGLMCFFYYWTKEVERAVSEIRNDRKSMGALTKRFTGLINRFSHMLSRGVYRPMSIHLDNTQKLRVEGILGVSIFVFTYSSSKKFISQKYYLLLRNLARIYLIIHPCHPFLFQLGFFALQTIEKLTTNKLRDVNDFELYQTIKCYRTQGKQHTNISKTGTPAKTPDINSRTITTTNNRSNNNNTNDTVRIEMLDKSMSYQNEFLGCDLGSVVWITSDKAVLNLMQAVSERKAGCVSSKQASGQSDVIDVSFLNISYLSRTLNLGLEVPGAMTNTRMCNTLPLNSRS